MLVPRRDIPETESWAIGPAARLFEATPDADGVLAYHLEGHRPQTVPLGPALARVPLAVVSIPALLTLFRRDEPELLAGMTFFLREDKVSLLYAPEGPVLRDIRGERRPLGRVAAEVGAVRGRALVDEIEDTIAVAFLMNPGNRANFSEDLLSIVRNPQQLNRLEVIFEAGTGEFRDARLVVQDRDSQRLLYERHSTDFPFVFPSRPKPRTRFYTAPKPREAEAQAASATGDGPASAATPGQGARPAAAHGATAPPPPPRAASIPAGPPPPAPLPRTRHLPVEEMLAAVRAEPDPARRWLLVEENLRELRPDRTFRLLGQFGALIHEHVDDWPAGRMKEFFGDQPAGAMQMILPGLLNDVVLVLLEDHPAREELMDVWRDNELERLLRLRTDGRPADIAAARGFLNVGPDADERTIRKVWRTVLGFLNVDFGRREETALHQKKDEIAKRLQAARDLLTHGRKGRA